MAAQEVRFTLNGEQRSVSLAEASGKTLNEYIRFHSQYTGTKLSCAQGGCGACTVAVARPGTGPARSVPSCLTPLASVHGAAVLTAEGLCGEGGKAHPVAERVAKLGGSQCGFCTPGMVMQLWQTLSPLEGGKQAKEGELEQCLNGNLCRCTGYRPLMDCAKSFAGDSTVKSDLDPSLKLGPYDPKADPALVFPEDVAPLVGPQWLRPATLAEAMAALAKPGARAIAGGSAAGIYSELAVATSAAKGEVLVDLNGVAELRKIAAEAGEIRVGATVTWNAFSEFVASYGQEQKSGPLQELARRTGSIAGAQVRNLGTIGGNVAVARNKGFLSDWVPPLAALNARVAGVEGGKPFEEDLLAFVQKEGAFGGLVTSVVFPLPADSVVFRSFRVAKRSRNAHALANAGMAASVSGGKLSQVSLVLGAVDPKPCRLKNVERVLAHTSAEEVQSNLPGLLSNLSEKVSADLFPLACNFGRDQTAHIVCGFLAKFLAACFGASLPKEWESAEYCLHDAERHTETEQVFPTPEDIKGPLNKPMPKTSALDQATGRAKYTDDLAKPEGMLLAALVLCPEANVYVREVNAAPAKELLGENFYGLVMPEDMTVTEMNVADLLGMGGLPPQYLEGHNAKNTLMLGKDQPSPYGGVPCAMLLARGDNPRLLEQAAVAISKALVLERAGEVVIGDLQKGQEAAETTVMRKGKKPAKEIVAAAKRGEQGLRYVSGTFGKKSQSHFYMEGQSAICIPEEGGIVCYSANQSPDHVQKAICIATGLKMSQVSVSMKRVGGGFGGKAFYATYFAAMCADVAFKKNLPVRLVLPRETDMQVVGGRQELEASWEVAVDKDNKILALDYEVWLSHSMVGENVQKFALHAIAACVDGVYAVENISVTGHLIKQHVPERTAVRGPGHFEGNLLCEAVMDGVAASLKVPGHELREINMVQGKYNTSGLAGAMMPQGHMDDNSSLALWKRLKEKSGYEARLRAVEAFNAGSAWKKRGLSMTHARYGVFNPPGCCARVDLFKDGTVQIACSGSEIGQGLHVKVGQMVSTVLARKLGAGPSVEQMRFLPTSTEQTPNGTMTGGSTTSEGNMFAAGEAAEEMARRLAAAAKAAKKSCPKDKDLWLEIVDKAFGTKFMDLLVVPPNLSVVGMFFGSTADMMYETYGACVSEVELDVLTGESRVRLAQMMFDVGMSYNPLVDVGQMEGAFIMGLGQVQNEGVDFDRATGRCLTDNTWSYKPPIACDVPEVFKVELYDGRKERLNNPAVGCMMGALAKILGALGVPWKPTKVDKVFKSAKAIGEPPLLLASAPHSALHAAMNAAVGGPLPENRLPVPAKPFCLLPLLQGRKPGSGAGADDASTATGTSVSTANNP